MPARETFFPTDQANRNMIIDSHINHLLPRLTRYYQKFAKTTSVEDEDQEDQDDLATLLDRVQRCLSALTNEPRALEELPEDLVLNIDENVREFIELDELEYDVAHKPSEACISKARGVLAKLQGEEEEEVEPEARPATRRQAGNSQPRHGSTTSQLRRQSSTSQLRRQSSTPQPRQRSSAFQPRQQSSTPQPRGNLGSKNYGHNGFHPGDTFDNQHEAFRANIHGHKQHGVHGGPEGAYSVLTRNKYPLVDVDSGETLLYGEHGPNHCLEDNERTGNPVRVLRGWGRKKRELRYDGLYRVVESKEVEYQDEKGEGSVKWQFRLVRCGEEENEGMSLEDCFGEGEK